MKRSMTNTGRAIFSWMKYIYLCQFRSSFIGVLVARSTLVLAIKHEGGRALIRRYKQFRKVLIETNANLCAGILNDKITHRLEMRGPGDV